MKTTEKDKQILNAMWMEGVMGDGKSGTFTIEQQHIDDYGLSQELLGEVITWTYKSYAEMN